MQKWLKITVLESKWAQNDLFGDWNLQLASFTNEYAFYVDILVILEDWMPRNNLKAKKSESHIFYRIFCCKKHVPLFGIRS